MGYDKHRRRFEFWRRIRRVLARRREPEGPQVVGSATQDDLRRAEELIEKYGLQHLRKKS